MQEYSLEHFNHLYSIYLTSNIEHFQNVTRNVVSQQIIKKKLKKHSSIREDALNECILLMSDKIKKFYNTNKSLSFLDDQEQFNKYFTTFITNTIHWNALDKLNGLDSNIFITHKDIDEEYYFRKLDDEDSTINSDNILSEEYIYINAEDDDAYTKLYKIDLVHAGLPLKSAEKLQYINKIKKHLTDYERELFVLHFECEMNPVKIRELFKEEDSKYLKGVHRIRSDVKAMKEKIKSIVEIIKDDF